MCDRFLYGRLMCQTVFLQVDQHTASEIFHNRNLMFLRNRYQFINSHTFCKSNNTVVTGVYLQKSFRLFCDCFFIILIMCLVRRSDFHEACTALFHHIRNAEFTTNLDQLPAGNDYFSAFCQRT